MPCGCKVIYRTVEECLDENTGEWLKVNYCPMHAAAEEMLAYLKREQDKLTKFRTTNTELNELIDNAKGKA